MCGVMRSNKKNILSLKYCSELRVKSHLIIFYYYLSLLWYGHRQSEDRDYFYYPDYYAERRNSVDVIFLIYRR